MTKISNISYSILETFSVFFIALWGNLLLVSTLLFFIKQPVRRINFWIALIVTLIFVVYYTKQKFKDYILLTLSALMLIVVTFLPILITSGSIYDLSYDGQAYHQEAVIQFARGWNPVYMFLEGEATANLERWLNHYPKAGWILSSTIYLITGNIEHGKVMSLYIIVPTLTFCFWALWKTKLSNLTKTLASFALSLNPIFIYQSLTYYLDGILVSLLLGLAAVCFKIAKDKDKTLFWPFLFIFVIVANLKLTGIIFAIILSSTFIIFYWFADRLKISLKIAKYLVISLLASTLFVGYNPYLTNFAKMGHPLHPAMGKHAIEYTPTNVPENYFKILPPFRLVGSIFSKSSLARGEGEYAELKLPFTFSIEELSTFENTSPKTGGFGPIFGGIFLLTSAMLVAFMLLHRNRSRKILAAYVFSVVMLPAAIIDLSSVARYVPFVWWLSGFAILFFDRKKLISIPLFFLIVFNLTLITYTYYPASMKKSNKLEGQLKTLAAEQRSLPLAVSVRQFGSTKLKLQKYNIPYVEIFTENGECKAFLAENIARVCK